MVALLTRLAISLAVVFGLMMLAGRLVRRRGLASGSSSRSGRIEVLARQGLGRTSSVQLVRVGGRTLVLGVTDAAVSVLAEADPLLLEAELALAPAAAPGAPAPGWSSLVELLKERTARSS